MQLPCPIYLMPLDLHQLCTPPPADFSPENVSGQRPLYLAEEDVNRKSPPRDVEDGYVPKEGSKFFCIHSS